MHRTPRWRRCSMANATSAGSVICDVRLEHEFITQSSHPPQALRVSIGCRGHIPVEGYPGVLRLFERERDSPTTRLHLTAARAFRSEVWCGSSMFSAPHLP